MQTAKDNGYGIGLLYVGLRSAALARRRVEDRLSKGGHDVPVRDILRRYGRTLDHLPEAIAQSDVASIYDNSGSEPVRVLRVEHGLVTQLRRATPMWFRSAMSNFTIRVGQPITRPE